MTKTIKSKAIRNLGFCKIELLLLVLICTLIGFAGYRVYYIQNSVQLTNNKPNNIQADTNGSVNKDDPTAILPNPAYNKPANAPINIIGNEDCKVTTANALALLANNAPEYYANANKYIGTIECADKGTGMFAYDNPPRYLVGDATRKAGTVWYASTIVHESVHSRLYHDYLYTYSSQSVPNDIWIGETAEKSCLDAQYDVLIKIGGTQSQLDTVKNAISTQYYNVPYDQRWW